MCLDIAFSRSLALAAGATLTKHREGTDEQIANAKLDIPVDTFYVQYLESVNEYFQFPNYPYIISNSGTDNSIIIRANKWGSLYKPLTEWLINNNITWSEF